jgi:predicted 3-demethylubiquinone-9 3-methyltransferase (glyoxalase superfamily)
MPKITPCLWFDGKAEEAAKFYVSVFKKDSKILSVSRYGDAGPGKRGSVMTVTFRLHGQQFTALNGGPQVKFTPAISFAVSCKTQREVDSLWGKLLKGGSASMCGWLEDKYGVSWQIIPAEMMKLMQDKDPERSARVMKEMLTMVKLDIRRLKQAAGKR